MAYNYEYPYVAPDRVNADWLLKFVKDAKILLESYKLELERLGKRDEELQKQIDRLAYWIDNFNEKFVMEIVERWIATMIFVEIDNNGYISYYIPSTWAEVNFNTTGLDITIEGQIIGTIKTSDVEYGRLVLTY